MTDPSDVLRDLAEDLKADAAEFDPTDDRGSAVKEGLGRAAGRAEARADELDRD